MEKLLTDRSDFVRRQASALGFDACGFARVGALTEEMKYVGKWLTNGLHGQMSYMEDHFEKRLNPSLLMPESKSVIVVLLNYYPGNTLPDSGVKISKYAYGRDYHKVMKAKLKELVKDIETNEPDSQHRVFVDTAPLLEKAWAQRAGLGWIGKNTLLINRHAGSFYFIGVILSSLEFEYNPKATTDFCGSCTKCLQACPTNALLSPRVLDSRRCISYLTIELKDAIPEAYSSKLNQWVFGCDICQDVCPWNKYSRPHITSEFVPRFSLAEMLKDDWQNLDLSKYEQLFNGTPVRRAKFNKLKDNIRHVLPDDQLGDG